MTGTPVQPSFSPSPSLLLAGLDAATTYTLSVLLTDPAGNADTVSDLELTTPPAPDTQAPKHLGARRRPGDRHHRPHQLADRPEA